MLKQLGELGLYTALLFSLGQSILPFFGAFRKNPYLLALAKPCAIAQFSSLIFAYACLTIAFTKNDFSIAYVAANSHSTLPLLYKLTAVWGAHEGSILLWILILSFWTIVFLIVTKNKSYYYFISLVTAVLGLLSFSFLCFLLLTSNPFISATSTQTAQDLNPLLQDLGFIIHPPMLYIGYVGFAVAFALTQAALLRNTLDNVWATLAKQFAIAAWCFLTFGITLGSWWAYRVLGWGGFWFWDPVENVSLMPWIAGTALIHILVLVEKKDSAKVWAVILANLTFALSVLGTFLVRSGVLVSAHTFANDPMRGICLLILFGLLVTATIVLFLFRFKNFYTDTQLVLFSRETTLLLNSALLCVALLTILIGTLYPLILDTLHLGAISVGAPYFNLVLAPFVLFILFFMGCASLCPWQTQSKHYFLKTLGKKFALSLIISTLTILLLAHEFNLLAILTLIFSLWVILSFINTTAFFRGMTFAHSGFAIMIIGIMLSSLLQQEREVKMQPGEQVALAAYQFLFLDTKGIAGPNYRGIRATFDVTKGRRHIINLYPEKRIYNVRDMVMTTVDIHPGIFRDLYIALGEPMNENDWSVRIYYKPFVRFIWVGGLIMILGGVIAIIQRKKLTQHHNLERLSPW